MNTFHYHYLFAGSTSNGFESKRLDVSGAVAIIRHRHDVDADEMDADNPQAHNHTLKTGGPYFPEQDPIDPIVNGLPGLDLDGTGWEAP